MNDKLTSYPAQREAFEEHTRKICGEHNFDAEDALFRKPNGKYANPGVYAAWEGWQAAQQRSEAMIRELVESLKEWACLFCTTDDVPDMETGCCKGCRAIKTINRANLFLGEKE